MTAAASLVLVLGSSLLAAALPTHLSFNLARDECTTPTTPSAQQTYYGTGQPEDPAVPTRLRISNGGAGLSGLVGYLANAFIASDLKRNASSSPYKACFIIEWIVGDTTETLQYLGTGQADVGITYNKAAECQAMADGVAIRREYGFRDHFYLVGPPNNPANLSTVDKNESVLTQFQKIVRTGNNPNLTQFDIPTRFLSRYDKSATNIKDSELFVRIGQVPWGLAYSKWYHQYPMYPIDALTAAAVLKEYTVTDRGTWLSTPSNITDLLVRYNEGKDENETDPLLNPAFFLSSGHSCADNKDVADRFLNWTISEEGQAAIGSYTRPNSTDILYTGAPTGNLTIKNCDVSGL
ncbi:hypothetical protein BDV93DRAFT_483935 [Ceratobasidium sp. AG-I]|nr:hypothetical protein BDV93DRAFT_483935 [Ceratobasidium sp. AG-I]